MRIFLKSFGCSANQSDGYYLAGCLSRAGYELVDSPSLADLVVYNTCAVKGPTENRMIEECRRIQDCKKLVVAGCLPLINFERLRKTVRFDAAVGPAAAEHIVEVVKEVSNGNTVLALEGALRRRPRLDLPRLQTSSVISVTPISYGCLGSCAYCCVTSARGRLRSYSRREIVQRVRKDVDKDFLEFWLTAQDTGCYGKDIGSNLPELLQAVCEVNGNFKVRVGMMTPNMIMDTLEDLIRVFRNEKIFKFLHLPVQSGNNHVLERMRRFYSTDDFRTIIKEFRNAIPAISLATDVICGFPGEDEHSFKDTLTLLEEVQPDVVNVSKFFARPKTSAAEMKDVVPPIEVKRRSSLASAHARRIVFEKNKTWIGWKGPILIDEIGKIAGTVAGRNHAYKTVVIAGPASLLGKTVSVTIVKAFQTYLVGEVCQ
jgi:threonylcarbamoyladenosine tRNA methylthiotransferase CDKAL1